VGQNRADLWPHASCTVTLFQGASYDISIFVFNMSADACLYLLTCLPQVTYAFFIVNDQKPSLNSI